MFGTAAPFVCVLTDIIECGCLLVRGGGVGMHIFACTNKEILTCSRTADDSLYSLQFCISCSTACRLEKLPSKL